MFLFLLFWILTWPRRRPAAAAATLGVGVGGEGGGRGSGLQLPRRQRRHPEVTAAAATCSCCGCVWRRRRRRSAAAAAVPGGGNDGCTNPSPLFSVLHQVATAVAPAEAATCRGCGCCELCDGPRRRQSLPNLLLQAAQPFPSLRPARFFSLITSIMVLNRKLIDVVLETRSQLSVKRLILLL